MIIKYIEEYFKTHKPEDAWNLSHELVKKFDISFPVAFSYVSHYLSEKWISKEELK